MRTQRLWSHVIIGTGLALVAACGAGGEEQGALTVRPGDTAEPGDNTPAPVGGPNGTNVPSGDENTGFVTENPEDALTPMGCQQAERSFIPKIPTVFVLVDRSGTMFDPISDGVSAWTALRGGVLEVMRELDTNVRFGFGAFSGQTVANQCELQVPLVPPALDNYQNIATLYEPLDRPIDSKDTPTVLALREVVAELRADTTEGDKYILFVTDGEPDYCNDGNQLCPPDSVVGLLQSLAAGTETPGVTAAPIQTLVFGVSSPQASILPSVLQGFANAGAGLGVAPMLRNETEVYNPNNLFDQCNGVPGWAADFALSGKPLVRGESIGTYTTDPLLAGNAPVYRPDPTDQAALTEQIRTALAGVKSCTFDLGEDGVQVDLTRQDLGELARVVVNGAPVPFDPVNGWSMLSETTVQLEGTACTSWRSPTVETSISFDFPCDIFVVIPR
jgi:hypothetical protein